MKSNFKFIERCFPILFETANMAEKYLYSDYNGCLIKLGMIGETVVNLIIELDWKEMPKGENTHATRIRYLKKRGLIPKEIDDILYALRTTRNEAVHANYDDGEKCQVLLKMTYSLACWFMATYGDPGVIPPDFVVPEKDDSDQHTVIKDQEKLIEKLTKELGNIQPQDVSPEERSERSKAAINMLNMSEKETRYLIDEQLRKVGWEVDSIAMRYSKGVRPTKGKNLAIAEWPTNAISHARGHVDYALFVGEQLVGMIEVKDSKTDISAVIDSQCKEYASHVKEEHSQYVIKHWNQYQVPFVYAGNGRKYLEQVKEKSGIWYLDLRKKTNTSTALRGWPSPRNLMELLEKDVEEADKKLENTDFDLLRDPDGLNLREYQVEAIAEAEKAVIGGSKSVLLSMATGTGKTRTILGMMYRFLKSGRFNRVLFLVDRTALGEQAQDVFKEVKLEDLMTLDEIYNTRSLQDKDIERETKIQVATVQSMVKRILFNDAESMPGIGDYDLIIIDEAHRGYTLDKELDDDELLYRNQDDFTSKYRAIIEYFSAVKIALTATPALHTTEIFGKPVYAYSYRRAVVEGYLVDHDAPHILKTKLSIEGISYDKGDIVPIYDPVTGDVMNSDALQDELSFEVEQFNRSVITKEFNRAVLEEISKDINPEGDEKTLIFAVNDSHADLIVSILREIYAPMGVDQDAIMKITGKIGDKKRVLTAIKRFKNEKYPNIAVTVDLLTTGIDVPEIDTLIFMRRVKSRILFEQMLGRATRLCNKIGKSRFQVYDPVGVYESMQDVSTMKPIAVNAAATFEDLVNGLEVLETDEQVRHQIDLIVAKMRRREKSMSPKAREQFKLASQGKTPLEFIEEVISGTPQEMKTKILEQEAVFTALSYKGEPTKRAVVISDKEDELVSHTRGYGDGQKPEDYLESFKKFVEENAEKIETLNILCRRPSSLTRQGLAELKLVLDSEGFTETQLNSALASATNEEIMADIISLVRAHTVGAELLGHEDRITKAVSKLKKAHNFTKMQQGWINRIEKYLLEENVIDDDTFEQGAFKTNGGFKVIDNVFGNKLKDYMIELNQYLYEDGGRVA